MLLPTGNNIASATTSAGRTGCPEPHPEPNNKHPSSIPATCMAKASLGKLITPGNGCDHSRAVARLSPYRQETRTIDHQESYATSVSRPTVRRPVFRYKPPCRRLLNNDVGPCSGC
jgi:hypothetical protein